MKYCCLYWAGAAKSSLSSLKRVQKSLCGFCAMNPSTLPTIPQTKRCQLPSTLSLCLCKRFGWVTLRNSTSLDIHTKNTIYQEYCCEPFHSLCIPHVRSNFLMNIFRRNATFWNRLERECFSDHNLTCSGLWLKVIFPTYPEPRTAYFTAHATYPFSNPLLRVALGLCVERKSLKKIYQNNIFIQVYGSCKSNLYSAV